MACGLILIGLTLGIEVSSPYFGVAALGLIVGAMMLLVSLLRAMRPALRRPTNVGTEDWPAHYTRKLGDPPAKGANDAGRARDHQD